MDVYNPTSKYSPPGTPALSVKRKRSHDEELSRSNKRSKRRRTSLESAIEAGYPDARLSREKLEADYYAAKHPDDRLQTFVDPVFAATGNRAHVLGLRACGLGVRFYMFDHAGTIYTKPLDLRDDAKKFIVAILSLSFLDPVGLGLEPILKPPTGISISALMSTPAGSYIEVDGISFYTERLIHAPTIFGRGAVVYEAIPALSDASGSPVPQTIPEVPAEVVLKMSWQVCGSPSEEELLRLAAERGVQGIVHLYKSATFARLSKGIRGKLVPVTMYADRELRIQVIGPRATPLFKVVDNETFRTAFKSLVNGEL